MPYHVLMTANLTTETVIEGFLITGGLANGDGAILYNSKIVFNYIAGGMCNVSSSPSMVNMMFSGNSANSGGGMYNDSVSSPNIVNTIFSENIATTSGAGMVNSNSSSPNIVNTVFSGNSANSGGGMYNSFSSSPSIVNSVFSGNSASSGRGMFNNNSSPSIVNSVFSGNSASDNDRGGIDNTNSSVLTIYNTVFYGNGVDITNDTNASTTGGNNFSENYEETGFTALDADPFYRSSDPIGTDGKWFTDDDGLKPKIGSPIIDAGDADKLPSDTADLDGDGDTTEAIPFDIRGRSRALGTSVDVGAYEYDSTSYYR